MKDRGEKRAENYSKGAGSMQSYSDYLNGYSQALKDSKAPEMLDMLNVLRNDYGNYIQNILQDSHRLNRIKEIEQLIKEATEL